MYEEQNQDMLRREHPSWDDDANFHRQPLTLRDKAALLGLLAVTGLWVALLVKIGGWVVVWLKGVL